MTHDAAAQQQQPANLTAAALALHDAGLSVIPAAIDGTKAPLGAWKRYQHQRMSVDELRGWFDGHHPGIGIVTGAISGNLEMLELEARAVHTGILQQLLTLAHETGLADLLARLMTGYLEQSPSGGIHILYRLNGAPVPGNLKLARTADRQPLIETRGEGGFTVVAPSHGTTHPTGRPWTLLAGGPATIPTITSEERDAFHSLCMTFDQTPPPAAPAPSPQFAQPTGDRPEGGTSPGDDYEARTDWADILTPHGWTLVTHRGNARYWRRPGKPLGISATTGMRDDRDRLYVFTTSTEFETEVPYTKFGAYALLHHGGDHTAAARALHRAGYGTPAPEEPRPAQAFTQPTNNTDADGQDEQPPTATVDEPQTYSLTDDGNALRLVDAHQHTIRYCPERNAWLTWTGHRWAWDNPGTVHELARTIARALPTEDGDQRRHRKISLSARGLANMLTVARTDPRIVAPIRALDAAPYDLNTPGGLVDLRTGQLRPADPAALCARSTTVAPDFEQPPERWLRFLAQTFAGDNDMTTYVQRLIGVSLVGRVLEQLLPFPYGSGANGKSTLMGVMMRVLGIGDDGYALSAPSELLLATQHSDHPTEIARLSGTRLVVTSELEDGQRFAEAKVKLLTGGDPIAARFMRGDYFTFIPTHTIWMPGNHQPDVRSGGPAFWRRLRLLPFLHVVPPEEQEKGLETRLVDEEGPAILAWAIRGAADYFKHGLVEPESVRAATEQYAREQDSIGQFVEQECETGSPAAPDMWVKATELRTVYEAWCHAEGERATTVKAFSMALQKRWNVIVEKTRAGRIYRGIKLGNPSHEDAGFGRDDGGDKIGGPGW